MVYTEKMIPIEFLEPSETRYDRHSLISWWDQKKVSDSKVIVVGAGALGNEVLKLLALIGVGNLTIVDFDVISKSNLARMILFRESDIGKSKVEVAAKRLLEINPEINITAIHDDIRFAIGLGVYRTADLVFGCLDSVNARWVVNRKCMRAGVEWLDSGISDYHGQVARYSPHNGACYECNFTERTIERFNQRYSCPFGLISGQEENKVPTTAITTSIIAAIQVQQGLMMLHNIEDGLKEGERFMFSMKPYLLNIDKLPVNNDCLAHNPLPKKIIILTYSPDYSVNEVIQKASKHKAGINTLVLPYDLVTEFSCVQCGNREQILKPKERVGQVDSHCPNCGQLREPEIHTIIRQDTSLADLTFSELSIPNHEILEFTGTDDNIFIQFDSQSDQN